MKVLAIVLVAFALTACAYGQEEEKPKGQLTDALRKMLESTIQKIKERVDVRHQKITDLIAQGGEIADRLKDLHADAGDKARDLLAQYKDKARELWEKIKDRVSANREQRDLDAVRQTVKDLGVQARERFTAFTQWLREQVQGKLEKARDAKERFTTVAREIRDHAREMRKEAVREGIEALRPHREQLGGLWREALEAARNALRRPTPAPAA